MKTFNETVLSAGIRKEIGHSEASAALKFYFH